MNEIEEYLLMIYLESINSLSVNDKSVLTSGEFSLWEQFKKEELGRTIPEEFEFYVSDYGFYGIKGGGNVATFISRNKNEHWKNKIKITVVEND